LRGERRTYQGHAFDGADYELTFSAAVKAIRNEGYSVKIQDRVNGQITAIYRVHEGESRPAADIDDGRDLILNFDQRRKDAVWVRLSLQDLEPITLGVQTGREITAAEAYDHIYRLIETELAQRKK